MTSNKAFKKPRKPSVYGAFLFFSIQHEVCELCSQPGFVTATGSIYLETHHVVPLAAVGLDHPSNVVAICPQDHRRAHYGAEREEIVIQLTARLVSFAAQ